MLVEQDYCTKLKIIILICQSSNQAINQSTSAKLYDLLKLVFMMLVEEAHPNTLPGIVIHGSLSSRYAPRFLTVVAGCSVQSFSWRELLYRWTSRTVKHHHIQIHIVLLIVLTSNVPARGAGTSTPKVMTTGKTTATPKITFFANC